jgi:hypothetical protein
MRILYPYCLRITHSNLACSILAVFDRSNAYQFDIQYPGGTE